jgi:hypothetical protein
LEEADLGVLFALILGAAGAPTPSWATSSVTFVQAVVVAPDPVSRTLGYVDASGRSRSHPVSGEVAPRLGRLRAGDQVIVVLSGSDPVVQDVRLSQAAPVAPAETEVATAAPVASPWTVVPPEQMRPTWPNPYSRFHKARLRKGTTTTR